MTNITNFDENNLNFLRNHFIIQIDEKKSTSLIKVLRSNVQSDDDAKKFIKLFSESTNTDWIFHYNIANPKRITYRKAWVCHHTQRRKKNNSKRNAGCSSKISILIKNVSKYNMKSDWYLCCIPPLPAVIEIYLEHSHIVDTADRLRMRRVSDRVKEKFIEYFKHGFSQCEARYLHEENLLREYSSSEVLSDASLNPTVNQIGHLHNTWQKQNFGTTTCPSDKKRGEMESHKEKGEPAKIKDVGNSVWVSSLDSETSQNGYHESTEEENTTDSEDYADIFQNTSTSQADIKFPTWLLADNINKKNEENCLTFGERDVSSEKRKINVLSTHLVLNHTLQSSENVADTARRKCVTTTPTILKLFPSNITEKVT